jgi:anaerobic selenocysteine-containing dehydrogenase
VSTKLNRSHLVHGRRALILPCLGRTEIDLQATGPQFVTVEDSMSAVHLSQGNLRPQSDQQRSEVAIVAGLAQAVFANNPEKKAKVAWKDLTADYDGIRDHIEKVVPGFENFNARVRKPGGFYLPHPVRERRWNTSTEKAKFVSFPLPIFRLAKDRLLLMTLRSHDQFNTTIYGLHDRYRGIKSGRRVIFMNEGDIVERNLQAGQWVDITSHFAGEERVAEKFLIVAYNIPKQCAAAYFPETNVLVPIGSVVGRSNTPAYKSIEISVTPTRALAGDSQTIA